MYLIKLWSQYRPVLFFILTSFVILHGSTDLFYMHSYSTFVVSLLMYPILFFLNYCCLLFSSSFIIMSQKPVLVETILLFSKFYYLSIWHFCFSDSLFCYPNFSSAHYILLPWLFRIGRGIQLHFYFKRMLLSTVQSRENYFFFIFYTTNKQMEQNICNHKSHRTFSYFCFFFSILLSLFYWIKEYNYQYWILVLIDILFYFYLSKKNSTIHLIIYLFFWHSVIEMQREWRIIKQKKIMSIAIVIFTWFLFFFFSNFENIKKKKIKKKKKMINNIFIFKYFFFFFF